MFSPAGSLPVLPPAGEGDQAEAAGQHDAAGHHHGDTEAHQLDNSPVRLGPCQGHEECSDRNQRVPVPKSQVGNGHVSQSIDQVLHFRLNIHSERNDRELYSDGAYIDIEHHLLRLALVSDVTPRANKKYSPMEAPRSVSLPSSVRTSPGEEDFIEVNESSSDDDDDKEKVIQIHDSSDSSDGFLSPPVGKMEMPPKKKTLLQKIFPRSEDKGKVKKGPAKGTGYSNYNQPGWDIKKFMAAQMENDRQIQIVLEKILVELKKLHSLTTVKTRNLPDLLFEAAGNSTGSSLTPVGEVETEGEEERGCKRKRKHSPSSQTPVDSRSDLYAVLEGSALVPFLESRLKSSSFLEICKFVSDYENDFIE